MKRLFKNFSFKIGFFIITALFLLMVLSIFYTPFDPVAMNFKEKLQGVSTKHLLGTDNFGRDVLSRIMMGSRTAFLVGITTNIFGITFGLIFGSLSGYLGGWYDTIIMKITESLMAFPGILLALMMIAIFGTGMRNTIIALGVMSVPRFTRIIRSGYIKYKNYPFVNAAKLRGASTLRIMYVHILPNLLSSIAVTSALSFTGAVLGEAGLSYLGLGIQPPDASWGKMLNEAQPFLFSNPSYSFIPGIFITLLVLGFNLMADGARLATEEEL